MHFSGNAGHAANSRRSTPEFGTEAAPPQETAKPKVLTVLVPCEAPAIKGSHGPSSSRAQVALCGSNWVTEGREVSDDVETEFEIELTGQEDAITAIAVVAWGANYFPETQIVAVSPTNLADGIVRAAPMRLRRRCDINVTVALGEDLSPPVSASEVALSEDFDDALTGTIMFSANALWATDSAALEGAFADRRLADVRSFVERAQRQIPVRRQLALAGGRGVVNGLPEGVVVTVDASGANVVASRKQVVVTHPATEVRLTSRQVTNLSVLVVDEFGLPVKSARCEVLRLPAPQSVANPRPRVLRSGNTDTEGRWDAPVSPGVALRLIATDEHRVASRDFAARVGTNDIQLVLGEGHLLQGEVVDESGGPVPNLKMRLVSDDDSFFTLAHSDDQGRFRVSLPTYVARARIGLWASEMYLPDEDFTTESLNKLSKSAFDVPSSGNRIVLARPAIINRPGTVSIVFESSRQIHSNLRIEGERTVSSNLLSDAVGREPIQFQVPKEGQRLRLPATTYRLRAIETNIRGGSVLTSRYQEVDVRGGETTFLTFPLVEAVNFRVRILEPGGTAAAGIRVANDGLHDRSYQRTTNYLGIADFGYHAPGGHTISILHRALYAGYNNMLAVTLSPTGTAIDVHAVPAAVQVRIRCSDVDVPKFVMVSPWYASESAVQDDDGSFVFRGVQLGSWQLQPRMPGDVPETPAITPQQLDLKRFTDSFEFELRDGKLHRVN